MTLRWWCDVITQTALRQFEQVMRDVNVIKLYKSCIDYPFCSIVYFDYEKRQRSLPFLTMSTSVGSKKVKSDQGVDDRAAVLAKVARITESTTTTPIGEMEQLVAAAAAAAGVEVVTLLQCSSFALDSKQDQVLNVEAGVVNITSTIASSKHVTLTANSWVHLTTIQKLIDNEAKELNCQTRPVAYHAHICDGYYMSVTDGFSCMDLRHFYVPYGLACEHVHPSLSGPGLCLDEWAHLLELIPTIHERHPDLAAAQLCYMQADHMQGCQEGWHDYYSCFPFANRQSIA